MTRCAYDLVIVGGGLGGSALALAMQKRGAQVLVIEREEVFKDRIRGEGMSPWGTAEARELGIYEILREACAVDIRFFDTYMGPMCMRRDLTEATAPGAPYLNFYHPHMQEALLREAEAAGVKVRRGASVRGVTPGETPKVKIQQKETFDEVSARLVVAADGRGSHVRDWAGFSVERDPHRLYVSGVLLEGVAAPGDAVSLIQGFGRVAIFFPQREGRVRTYIVYHRELHDGRLQGPADMPRFIEGALQAGASPGWLSDARAVGPLATFEGADTWVEHPYRNGVALIGDAAASNDPSWGQGLSLTLRDVRTLRDKLLTHDDWDQAGHAYAAEHDRYYSILHTMQDWYRQLFMDLGSAADARRAVALPLIATDPTRIPDTLLSGPNQPLGDAERARFMGE